MDPDANLKEQRELAALIQSQLDEGETPDEDDVLRLSELVIALDEWIAGGGFLPAAWRKP